MCNLFHPSRDRRPFRVVKCYVGNLPPMPGAFPDYPAPVIRNMDAGTEMVTVRWGMPPPPRTGGPPVTNIRNTSSPRWRGWLKPENRCLAPANSFAEYAPEPNPEPKNDVVWFVLNEDRPLFALAGMWTTFNGDRGTTSKPIPGPHQVYGFPTTEANAVVKPIHRKAMRDRQSLALDAREWPLREDHKSAALFASEQRAPRPGCGADNSWQYMRSILRCMSA